MHALQGYLQVLGLDEPGTKAINNMIVVNRQVVCGLQKGKNVLLILTLFQSKINLDGIGHLYYECKLVGESYPSKIKWKSHPNYYNARFYKCNSIRVNGKWTIMSPKIWIPKYESVTVNMSMLNKHGKMEKRFKMEKRGTVEYDPVQLFSLSLFCTKRFCFICPPFLLTYVYVEAASLPVLTEPY